LARRQSVGSDHRGSAGYRVEVPYPGFDPAGAKAWVASLLAIQPPVVFDPAQLEAAIAVLNQSGRFSAIHADIEERQQGVRVTMRLTPARRIRAIDIKGQYPLFEKDVKTALGEDVGGIYRPAANPDQARRIADLYRDEGFPDPQVTVKGVDQPESGLTDLKVAIAPGPHWRLGALTIEGNRRFADLALKARMRVWRRSFWPGVAGRFLVRDLKADVDGLKTYLGRRGHAAAIVEAEHRVDPSTASVNVTVRIEEGPRFRSVFVGNTAISDRRLRKDLTLAVDGVGDAGLRRSVRNMVQRYREAGFGSAAVRFAIHDAADADGQEKTVRFTIKEGARIVVEDIVVHGSRFLDEKKIRGEIVTGRGTWHGPPVLVKQKLEEDLVSIERLYQAHGFSNVRVGHRLEIGPDPTRAIVHLDIDEGPRTLVAETTITGAGLLDLDPAVEGLKLTAGEPFRQYMLDSDRNALAATVSEKGFPHVRITSDAAFSPDRSSARIFHHIDTGPAVVLAGVWPNGNLRTGNDIVVGALDLTPGQPFSLRKVQQGRQQLSRVAIF
jgi:outer membrane protein insertion porin family